MLGRPDRKRILAQWLKARERAKVVAPDVRLGVKLGPRMKGKP
jgi:hypothetical protein